MKQHLNILIVAQNASTRFGGEAIIPVHYFRELSCLQYNVTMVTHERNRLDLESYLGQETENIHYTKDTFLHKTIWRIGKSVPKRVGDVLFGTLLNFVDQGYQHKIIREIIKSRPIDIIHQPIPVSPKLPSTIFGFGIPVVIGPMNGGMSYPQGWESLETRVERWTLAVSRVLSPLLNRLVPGKAKAAILLVANERTRAALPIEHDNVRFLVENGVDFDTFRPTGPVDHSPTGGIRLVYMGRLVTWKAVNVTLEAVALARDERVDVTLDILGDGPDRADLERLAASLGISEAVTFHGFLPQSECAEILRASDALILNSVYECGGAVVLEAMALSLPVIATKWGGPMDYVDEATGILVDPVPRNTFGRRLADAIAGLASDPSYRIELGRAGALRALQYFSWKEKAKRVSEIYRDAISPPTD
ncbi:MAG: glycosyltransferase family 4 protein [Parvularcula sp.]|jgi:glycosyltransferase involved in cell wall biosynthesis|nr:glycosyltransferase family 4 protein [Parvularcula sp.]